MCEINQSIQYKICDTCLKNKEINKFGHKSGRAIKSCCHTCYIEKSKLESKFFIELNNIIFKKCSQCKEFFSIDNFFSDISNASGLNTCCKKCIEIERNKYKLKFTKEEWRDKRRKWEKTYRSKPEAREKYKRYQEIYNNDPQTKIRRNEYINNKLKNDPHYRMKEILSKRIRNALKGITKKTRTMIIVGCTIEEFKIHVESQFIEGMHWKNHGRGHGKWNIEHIIPCELFDLSKESHQKACFNYKNVRPFWFLDNQKKGDKLDNGKRANKLSPAEKQQELTRLGFGYLFENEKTSHNEITARLIPFPQIKLPQGPVQPEPLRA